MNLRRHALLALIPLLFLLGRSALQAADSAHKVWVCPPCGGDCDKDEYDHPGICPHCGMTLVEKGSLAHQTTVAILLFPGVQIIDYSGPWEVFGQAHYRIFTVAATRETLTTVFGEHVTADYDFGSAPKADILVVPGGNVGPQLWSQTALIDWIRTESASARFTLSVCTGAFLVAKAGLLDGLTATTFHGALKDLEAFAPKTRVVHDQRFVDNGKIVVTAGLSSGIDGALAIVSKADRLGSAETVALNMEYNWDRKGSYARAALADRNLNFPTDGIDGYFVSREGDRTHWTESIRLFDKAGGEAIKGKLDALLASQAHWSRKADGSWQFKDSEGAPWTGTSQVSEADGLDGGRTWTLSIQQSVR